MQKYLTLILVLLLSASVFAQHEPIQPFEELGIKVKVLTLSNGKYQESFPNDTTFCFGSVRFNRVTGEVVSVIENDTLYGEYNLKAEVVSRWLSPDPLEARFPNWSPYVYANDNPVIFIDPTGGFSVPIHIAISKAAFASFDISDSEKTILLKANKRTDTRCFSCPKHFDNITGIVNIDNAFTAINAQISPNSSPEELGEALHTTQDFYAHSNYVESYIEFYESQGGIIATLNPSDIPVYQDASQEFRGFLASKGDDFRTGSFNDTKVSHWLEKLGMKKEDDNSNPFSHENMNKDNEDSKQGKIIPKGSNSSYFKFAENLAERATSRALGKKYEKKETSKKIH